MQAALPIGSTRRAHVTQDAFPSGGSGVTVTLADMASLTLLLGSLMPDFLLKAEGITYN